METAARDDLAVLTEVDVDPQLVDALDHAGAATNGRPDHWVPPTQRRLSSAPPLATSLPVRGPGDGLVTDLPIRGTAPAAAPESAKRSAAPRLSLRARQELAPTAAAPAPAVVDVPADELAAALGTAPKAPAPIRPEVSFEQLRQEGLEWLRDLSRRTA